MKKSITILLAAMMVLTLSACSGKEDYDPTEDICPGKQPGVAGNAPVLAEGFDPNEDMSFTTADVNGNPVTNEVFAGTERGVWVVFWRTDNDKSEKELQKLNGLVDTANENGYKILGVVMDGEENADQAKEISNGLKFDNIIWNHSMSLIYEGIDAFFTKEYFEENKETIAQLDPVPKPGDPVSTRANSRGQLQSSCYLVPVGEEKLEEIWTNNDSNATYEELVNQEREALK